MNQEIFDAIEKQMNLASELMAQATELKLNADILSDKNQELEKTRETLLALHRNNSRLMQSRLLSQWGLRVRYAHSMVLLFSALLREERIAPANVRKFDGQMLYTKDGDGPYNSLYKEKETMSAGSWVLIWNEVEKRVKKRYQMFCDSIKKQKEAKNEKV